MSEMVVSESKSTHNLYFEGSEAYVTDVPVEAIEKIIGIHGMKGKLFLNALPRKLHEYMCKWKLSECKFYTYSQNLIYACKSTIFGDVLLKAVVPDLLFFTEIATYLFYDKNDTLCKLYEYSLEDGFMLIERIIPGDTLISTISDPIKRVDAFINIFNHFNYLPCDDTKTFPTYISLIEAFEKNLENDTNGFKKYQGIAKKLFYKVKDEYSRQYLLHGDLNQNNLLLCNNTFKVIDPQGIIGDPVFEISRYLLNELTGAIKANHSFNEAVVLRISKVLGLPVAVLYMLLLIDALQTASYHLGNLITKEKYEFYTKRCESAYKLCQASSIL